MSEPTKRDVKELDEKELAGISGGVSAGEQIAMQNTLTQNSTISTAWSAVVQERSVPQTGVIPKV